MKSIGGLFERLCDPAHLDEAVTRATRGKRRRPDVAWLLFCRESEVARLAHQLRTLTWHPGGFDLIRVRDPKPRVIARASIEDRVVHTALVQLIEPVFVRSLTDDTFACRRGMGTHRAVLRLLELVRRHPFALHLDIRSYFPSIDLALLRGLIERRVRDPRFMEVIDRILRSGAGLHDAPSVRRYARIDPDRPPPGRGLPIGSLTSQLFAAHVYLSGLDHFVKRELHVPGYVRYVDDLFLFGPRRGELRAWRTAVARWLEAERGLRLKCPEARVLSCGGHLNALGHRITRRGIEPLPRAFKRLKARVAKACVPGGAGRKRVDVARSMASSVGGILFG